MRTAPQLNRNPIIQSCPSAVSLRRNLMQRLRTPAVIAALLAVAANAAAQTPDPEVIAKIRDEGMNRSQVMPTMIHLCDVIGERLTGSPALKRANEWTKDKMASWGLQNAHLEPWGPFGRGWELEKFSVQVVSPMDIPLIAYPKAWSPALKETTADVVLVDATDEAGLEKYKGQLKGKVVMSGGPIKLEPHFTPQGSRYTDAELTDMQSAAPRRPRAGGPGAPGGPGGPGGPPANFRAQAMFAGVKLRFFMKEGVIAVLDGSRGDDGTIFVQSASVPPPPAPPTPTPPPTTPPAPGSPPPPPPFPRATPVWDKSAPKTLPQITVSSEQYNRMARMIQQGENLQIDIELKDKFFNKDLNAYITVAEIPGSDLKDQVVMVGGHMDSWHAGTGATDNGAGVVVAMEAARILKALNLQPRRTIRVALWSGEEEGLFGSRAYVANHFGSMPPTTGPVSFGGNTPPDLTKITKKPEYDKISAYYNLDNGTGKIRGIYLQGNEKAGPIFADWLAPFKDLGASTVTIRNTGSTDHVSFDAIGIPGFQFIQDTIEYGSRTHHSNQDVVDRVQEEDLKQASIIMATFLYETAMRDEMIPRKS
jgi:carboxypeptidase Q